MFFEIVIVGIVFSFLTLCVYFDYANKKEKQKIEAALRMEEMKRGYQPGTYSYKFTKRRNKRAARDFEAHVENGKRMERAELKEGIDDLMNRINNLETIMKAEEEK